MKIKPNRNEQKLSFLHALGGVGAALLLACACEMPFLHSRIERDSGIHMTAAREILRGRVLYRDLWENRPPGIHYTDALAFLLLGESVLTIRVCNILLLAGNTLVFFILAWRFIPKRTASLASLIFLLHLGSQANRDECNAIEMYMILPMMFTWLCGLTLMKNPRLKWGVLAGGAGGVALLFKQPAGTVLAAVALGVAFFSPNKGRFVQYGLRAWVDMAIGCALVWAPVLGFFAASGALGEMWDCLVRYNALYMAEVGVARRLDVLAHAFWRVGTALPMWLGAMGILYGASKAVQRLGKAGNGSRLKLLHAQGMENSEWVMLGMWALFDLAAVCYPGFRNRHYYIQLLPSWTLLGSAFLWEMWPWRLELSAGRRWGGAVALICALGSVVGLAAFHVVEANRQIQTRIKGSEFTLNEAVAYWLKRYSAPHEAVCVWGAEADLYFLAGRRVASRYFFTYPLQMPGYENERRVMEYVSDLQSTRPACIVDLSMESEFALSLFGHKPVPRHFAYGEFGPIREYISAEYVFTPLKQAPAWVRRDLLGRPPFEPQP